MLVSVACTAQLDGIGQQQHRLVCSVRGMTFGASQGIRILLTLAVRPEPSLFAGLAASWIVAAQAQRLEVIPEHGRAVSTVGVVTDCATSPPTRDMGEESCPHSRYLILMTLATELIL